MVKKAIIEGMCCDGCTRDVKAVLSKIYGITVIEVSLKGGYALFEGFVAKDIIADALNEEGYRLVDIVKA